MNLAPLLNAGSLIASHATAASAAIGIGAAQLVARKGTPDTPQPGLRLGGAGGLRRAGIIRHPHDPCLWSSSPFHVLSALTLISLVLAVGFARSGNIEAHRQTMLWVYAMALVLTGLFTLWPGRVLHMVFFGG